jgi:ubiquinone/menaquinone biosynthesis C-methylase UbiE
VRFADNLEFRFGRAQVMSAQYDAIAADYQRTKASPLRQYVEAYSFFSMLGDVQGKSLLDLACGEGFYTRKLCLAGAVNLVGVDISTEMIELARQAERSEPLGIEYLCADAATLSLEDRFDVVSAAYLLHYSRSTDELEQMCRRIAGLLKPAGRLVCINENPLQAAADYPGYTQYGFNKSVQSPRVDGSTINYSMVSGRTMIRFDAFYYSQDCYEAALRAAGFRDVCWHELALDPAGASLYGDAYFQEYMDNPPIIGLECRL